MWVRKKTQYGGDVVMFLLNKIIKNVSLAHGFKTTNHVHGFRTMCMVLKLCAHGFKTCARPSKEPMVVGGPCIWF